MNDILNDYFEWLYSIVKKERVIKKSYRKLLAFLHSEEFVYVDDYDSNRAADGEQLRWRYVYEAKGCEDILDWKEPCTVLEMLIALSFQMENIMEGSNADYSVGYWFWMMLTNLGLEKMTDNNFNKLIVDDIIYKFMHRKYEPNGEGNIFVLDDCSNNLRDVEIWWQMCWYLDSIM